MSASISRYLKDFSTPRIDLTQVPRYFADLDEVQPVERSIPVRPQLPPQPQIDVEAERRDAFQRGREAALAEARAQHAAEIADLNARHEAELEAMRVRVDNEVAAMVYDRFTDMGSQVATMICDQTARVLAPVMQDVLLEKAVRDLATMIRQSIGTGEVAKITVKGPLRLFEALQEHFGEEKPIFRHQETTDADLTVEVGDAILVTRMAAWADTVRKVLA